MAVVTLRRAARRLGIKEGGGVGGAAEEPSVAHEALGEYTPAEPWSSMPRANSGSEGEATLVTTACGDVADGDTGSARETIIFFY